MNRKSLLLALLPLAGIAALAGCASGPPTVPVQPQVDLQRFMGTWYVIGNIPTRPEREAFNAVETYALDADGKRGTRILISLPKSIATHPDLL